MKKFQTKTIRLAAFAKQSFTHRISFQEKNPSGFVERSFDAHSVHLEFHLQQLQVGLNEVDASKKSPDQIRGVSYRNI